MRLWSHLSVERPFGWSPLVGVGLDYGGSAPFHDLSGERQSDVGFAPGVLLCLPRFRSLKRVPCTKVRSSE